MSVIEYCRTVKEEQKEVHSLSVTPFEVLLRKQKCQALLPSEVSYHRHWRTTYSENRTPVFRTTTGGTNHYTNTSGSTLRLKLLMTVYILVFAKTLFFSSVTIVFIIISLMRMYNAHFNIFVVGTRSSYTIARQCVSYALLCSTVVSAVRSLV